MKNEEITQKSETTKKEEGKNEVEKNVNQK